MDESHFTARKDRSGRLRPYCKECGKNAARARYTHHKRTQPFKLRCSRSKVKAARDGVPFDLTPEYLESIWTGFCPISGCELSMNVDRNDENMAELDRFVPERGYVQGNVHFLSRRMNRIKSDITFEEVKKLFSWMEKVNND